MERQKEPTVKLQKIKITLRRGATNSVPVRLETDEWEYATITDIDQSAPVRITATGHGIPNGWRAAVMNAKGMTDLNAANNPPKDGDLRRITVIDPNTVEINDINAAGMRAYTSGGQLAFRKPLDLSAYVSARMDIKAKVGADPLLSLNSTDQTLRIDTSSNALWIEPTVAQSLTLAAKPYVFDIELVRADGHIDAACLADSEAAVLPEVTTTEP